MDEATRNLLESYKVSVDIAEGEATRLRGEVKRMREVLESVQGVINESYGVSGYHLNGEIATWGELGLDAEIAEALTQSERSADNGTP